VNRAAFRSTNNATVISMTTFSNALCSLLLLAAALAASAAMAAGQSIQ
jgi:hypothetical protein